MQIALLGGSFDPPHLGHQLIARAVLQARRDIDEVWLLPTHAHHWKPMYASSYNRLAMTALLQENNIRISDIDVRLHITYSIETIRYLQTHTQHSYIWICGSDTVKDFHRWKEYQELQKRIPFLVIPRGDITGQQLPKNFSWLANEAFQPVSYASTDIRRRIREGLSINDFVPERVKDYILEKKLYK